MPFSDLLTGEWVDALQPAAALLGPLFLSITIRYCLFLSVTVSPPPPSSAP